MLHASDPIVDAEMFRPKLFGLMTNWWIFLQFHLNIRERCSRFLAKVWFGSSRILCGRQKSNVKFDFLQRFLIASFLGQCSFYMGLPPRKHILSINHRIVDLTFETNPVPAVSFQEFQVIKQNRSRRPTFTMSFEKNHELCQLSSSSLRCPGFPRLLEVVKIGYGYDILHVLKHGEAAVDPKAFRPKNIANKVHLVDCFEVSLEDVCIFQDVFWCCMGRNSKHWLLDCLGFFQIPASCKGAISQDSWDLIFLDILRILWMFKGLTFQDGDMMLQLWSRRVNQNRPKGRRPLVDVDWN